MSGGVLRYNYQSTYGITLKGITHAIVSIRGSFIDECEAPHCPLGPCSSPVWPAAPHSRPGYHLSWPGCLPWLQLPHAPGRHDPELQQSRARVGPPVKWSKGNILRTQLTDYVWTFHSTDDPVDIFA